MTDRPQSDPPTDAGPSSSLSTTLQVLKYPHAFARLRRCYRESRGSASQQLRMH